jgi:ribosomal-protein-alanine N-acetyltransferase
MRASVRARCRNPLTPVGLADGLEFSRAEARDLGALVALDRACFGARAWPLAQWRELVGSPGWRIAVVRDGERLVAVSVLLPGAPRAYLASLAVAPQWRRRRIGRLLLRDAVSTASAAGARWLVLEVDDDNRDAVRLYRRDGFVVVRRFREDRRTRLEMVRRLGTRRGRAALAMMPSA